MSSAKSRSSFPLPDLTWTPALPYWEGAAAGELRLPFCVGCGRANWYPKPACSACGETTFAWRPVVGTGTLFSYSVVRRAFLPQYRDLVPMVTGLVALDDVPVIRIVTRILECEPEELYCDAPVEAVFRPLSFAGVEGEVTAPHFRLRRM